MEWWGWAVVVTVSVIALMVLDRLVARGVFDRRTPKEYGPIGGDGVSGALGELMAVFQPGHVHVIEELARRRGDLVQPGDADPPSDTPCG